MGDYTERRREILKRAGLDPDIQHTSETSNLSFLLLMETLEELKNGKQTQYGDYVSEQSKERVKMAFFDHYVNLKRKMKRADNIIQRILDGEAMPDQLLDVYADMAVYAMLGTIMAYDRRFEK